MMLVWLAETTLVAMVLAMLALAASRWLRLGPMARHALWVVVLIKLVAPPLVTWPWSTPLVVPSGDVSLGPNGLGFMPENEPAVPSPAPAWEPPARLTAGDGPLDRWVLPESVPIGRWSLVAWGVASGALALWQIGRILRYSRRLRWALPAPAWLIAEARRVGNELGVRAPEILMLPSAGTPMLWFLGRPKLLVPERLVETLDVAAWQGILAHELAHLRRRDHWIRRLELAAGLLWWWNPLYWLTRYRLDAEAELACDEWAVLTFPEGRLAYAEALLEVCRSLSTSEPPAPTLGIAGAGKSLERRVTMILREQSPSRASNWVLMGAGLLALLALPGWSAPASSIPQASEPTPASATSVLYASLDVSNDEPEESDDADDDKKPSKASKSKKSSTESDSEHKREAERAARAARAERAAEAAKRRAAATEQRVKRNAERIAAEAKKKADAAAQQAKKKAEQAAEAKNHANVDRAKERAERAAAVAKKRGEVERAKQTANRGKQNVKTDKTDAKKGNPRKNSTKSSDGDSSDRKQKLSDEDRAKAKRKQKLERIKALQSQISKLSKELKALEDEE